MPTASKIRSGFNFLSSFYDIGTRLFFGKNILRSQTHFLSEIGKFNSVLILGGGTGKILIECLENKIGSAFAYVDISEKMIARTKDRLTKYIQTNSLNEKVEFLCGSYSTIPADKKFDLIITPYVLDCFTEEELSVALLSLRKHLSPTGKWLFADFNIPEKGTIKFFSTITVRSLYSFFNIICGLGIKKLPAFDKHFKELGFKTEKEKLFLKGLLCARIYSRQ